MSDETFGSDHHSIKCVYNNDDYDVRGEYAEENQVQIPWRKPPPKMKAIIKQVLSTCKISMKWVENVEEVDAIIEKHSEQIRGILNKIFKQGKKRKNKKVYWWNGIVNIVYLNMRRARRRMRKYKYDNLKQEFNECRREFRRVVRQAKLEAWKKFTSEITDPWEKLIKIVKATMSGKIQSRTLSDLEGTFAGNMKETLWLLGRQFFPCPDVKMLYHLDIELMVENTFREVSQGPKVTLCELRKAIGEMTTGTTPGLDLIINNMIRILAQEGRLGTKIPEAFQ